MRKTIAVLLVAGFAVAAGGRAIAADRAGISLEWGMGPTLQLGGGFDMLMDQQAGLNWDVSNDFAVSVFSGNGTWRGSKEYTNNTTPAITHKVSIEGARDLFGIAIIHSLPVLSFVKVGIELGMVSLNQNSATAWNSNGTACSGTWTEFGGMPQTLDQVASMEGIVGKVTLLKGESKGTYADISVLASLRFVQLPTTFLYGRQESDSTASPLKGIEPVESFNNLSIKVVASLGF